jgi:pyruvate kinase
MLWWWQAQQAKPYLANLTDFDTLCLSAESWVGDYPIPALAEGALQSMRRIARERDLQLACSPGALTVHYEMRSSAHTMRWQAVMTASD